MKAMKNFMQRLWKEESAQGATEYILLLVVVVAVVLIFKERIKEMVDQKLTELQQSMSNVN